MIKNVNESLKYAIADSCMMGCRISEDNETCFLVSSKSLTFGLG